MKEVLKAYWILIRSVRYVRIHLVYLWCPLVGLMTASKLSPPPLTAMNTILSMIAAAVSIYLYNDVQDLEADRMNPKTQNRPLVKGEVSKRDMEILAIISVGIGLGLSLFVNFNVFLLILTFLILGFSYSAPTIHLQKRIFLKYATMGTGLAISILVGGVAVDNVSGPIVFASVLSLIFTFAVYPIKDIRDMRGDKKVGKKTFPILFGPELTVRLAIVTLCAAAIASLVGYSQLGFNDAFPILATIIFSPWICVTYPLLKRWDDPIYVSGTFMKRIFPLSLFLQIGIILGAL